MNIPEVKKYNVRLFDFRGGMDSRIDQKLNPYGAAVSFNFLSENGALSDGEGFSELKIGGDVVELTAAFPKKIYYYKRYDTELEKRDDRLLIYADDGNVYEYDETERSFSPIQGLSFLKPPEGVGYKLNGKDVFMFSSGERLYVYDGETVNDYTAPCVTSMCLYNERLFVTTGGESTTLWFSENFDPTNWYVSLTEAGFIDFQDGKGKLLKLTESDGYLFVFRSYGITRVYAPYLQTEFSATNIEVDGVKIVGNSVVDCGKKTVYMTENGFYSFDGTYSVKILDKLDGFIDHAYDDDVVASFCNGRYYAKLRIKLEGKSETAVLSYNLNNGEYYLIKGADVTDIKEVLTDEGSALFALINGEKRVCELKKGSVLFDKNLKKIWKSAFTDFNISGIKTLARVSLYTKGEINMRLESDRGEKTVTIYGGKGLRRETIGLKGEDFSVTISSEKENASVSRVALEFLKV